MHDVIPTEFSWIKLVLALFFVALNGFFVAAEFAIVKVRYTQLEILAHKGHPLARLAKNIVNHLDPYLSATQLGITLASLGLGWLGEPVFAVLVSHALTSWGVVVSQAVLHSVSMSVAFFTISALHIVLGELVPKSIAIQKAVKVCLFVAAPMRFFYILFFPFLWFLNWISGLVLQLIGFSASAAHERAPSEAELKLIVEDSFEEGTISQGKRLLIDKAIEFSHKTVLQIMVPAKEMVCFYLHESIEQSLERAMESAHTRFPMLDGPGGRILGFVHMKDIIYSLENREVINLFDLIRPVLFFEGKVIVEQALKMFQKAKIHMAIVKDEAGHTAGLVTLEDVIEELVGDIDDEFDIE